MTTETLMTGAVAVKNWGTWKERKIVLDLVLVWPHLGLISSYEDRLYLRRMSLSVEYSHKTVCAVLLPTFDSGKQL